MRSNIKMEQPLLSIIIPVYNAESDLSRCIKSVCRQLYRNLQIILVDDGSTDLSGKLCDEFANEDKRIEVYHIKNSGSVKARKVGLKYAKGSYIGFVDADDYIDEDMYEIMMGKACETHAELIQCAYYCETKYTSTCAYSSKDGTYNIKDCKNKFISEGLLLHTNSDIYISNTIWSKLFVAKLIIECFNKLSDDQQYGEDLMCVCMCLLKIKRMSFIAKPYYHYTVKEASLSHGNALSLIEDEINVFIKIRDILMDNGCYGANRESLLVHAKNNFTHLIQEIDCNQIKNVCYAFPEISRLINKNIVIYGFGRVGMQYYEQICKYQQCNIVGVADKNYHEYDYDFVTVISAEQLLTLEFDILLIAVKNERLANSIRKDLIKIGINANKILWKKPYMRNTIFE